MSNGLGIFNTLVARFSTGVGFEHEPDLEIVSSVDLISVSLSLRSQLHVHPKSG